MKTIKVSKKDIRDYNKSCGGDWDPRPMVIPDEYPKEAIGLLRFHYWGNCTYCSKIAGGCAPSEIDAREVLKCREDNPLLKSDKTARIYTDKLREILEKQ